MEVQNPWFVEVTCLPKRPPWSSLFFGGCNFVFVCFSIDSMLFNAIPILVLPLNYVFWGLGFSQVPFRSGPFRWAWWRVAHSWRSIEQLVFHVFEQGRWVSGQVPVNTLDSTSYFFKRIVEIWFSTWGVSTASTCDAPGPKYNFPYMGGPFS